MKPARFVPWTMTVLLLLSLSFAHAGTIITDSSYAAYDAALGGLAPVQAVGLFTFNSISGGGAAAKSSGAYLGEGWVLTAAHVVEDANSFTFTINGSSYASTAKYSYSGWNGNQLDGNDVGLIQLDTTNVNALNVLLYDGTTNDLDDEVFVFAGYGNTGTGSSGQVIGTSGTRHAGMNVIEFAPSLGLPASVLPFDFDDPLDNNDGYSWSAETALTYEYMLAGHDSGGGAFVLVDGEYRLAGIASFATNNAAYGAIGGLSSLGEADYRDWIQDTTGYDFTTVPEPATLLLVASGLFTLLDLRRRRAA